MRFLMHQAAEIPLRKPKLDFDLFFLHSARVWPELHAMHAQHMSYIKNIFRL